MKNLICNACCGVACLILGFVIGKYLSPPDIEIVEIPVEVIKYKDRIVPVNVSQETLECDNAIVVEEKAEELLSDDRELMARVVYAESNGEPFVGKVAVAYTIINRSESWQRSISSVIKEQGQFAIADTTNDDCRQAVDYAWEEKDTALFPKDMFWFCSDGYSIGKPYVRIGGHYFSTENNHR